MEDLFLKKDSREFMQPSPGLFTLLSYLEV